MAGDGLSYKPRPVFQSYSVYSASLIELNRAFLRSGSAADTLLFDVKSLDYRFPPMQEGTTWLDIVSLYDPTDIQGEFLVLSRREAPRAVDLVPAGTHQVNFGDAVPLPQDTHLVWAAIAVEKTLAGRIANFLYKSPILEFIITLADGTERWYHFVPNEARSGFLLAPIIDNGLKFAAMVSGDAELEAVLLERVAAIRIARSDVTRWFYRDTISISFYKFVVDGQVDADQSPALTAAFDRGEILSILLDSADDGAIPAQMQGNNLNAHAPMRLSLAPPPANRLSVAFGIYEGAWSEGKTDGVVFRIAAEFAGGIIRELWSRTLTPLESPGDRGKQLAVITLPQTMPVRLIFETLPNGNNHWDWSYWSDVRFD